MQGTTHIIGGVAVGMLCASALGLQGAAFVGAIGVATVGSLFPDIDTKTSRMGSKVKPVSVVISKAFGHRTLFHSPILYVTMYLMGLHWLPQYKEVLDCFIAGVVSHLFLDMLNVKGIPLFYPFKRMYHLAGIKTGGAGEMMFRVMLAIAICIGIVFRITQGHILGLG